MPHLLEVIESEFYFIPEHLRGVKVWGSKQPPPIFENSNLEDKTFRAVIGQDKKLKN